MELKNIEELESALYDILKDGLVKEIKNVNLNNADDDRDLDNVNRIKIEDIILEILNEDEKLIYLESSLFNKEEWNELGKGSGKGLDKGLDKGLIDIWCFRYKEKVKDIINKSKSININSTEDKYGNDVRIYVELHFCLRNVGASEIKVKDFGRIVVRVVKNEVWG